HAYRLPGRAERHHHRHPAGGRPHERRDRAAAVHRPQQPVLVGQYERADGEPAGDHLPVRAQPLRGLAAARLGRSAVDHRDDPHLEHRGPGARHDRDDEAMNADLATAEQSRRHTMRDNANGQKQAAAAAGEGLLEKVSIRNLDFYYDKSHAIKNVNLPLYDKRVTAFIGPSGCGKSTLLRVLNRMYDLYPKQRATGEVLLDGKNILASSQDLNLLRAQIGMVFQKPTPFPMSIYDNIAFGVRLYEKLSSSEMDERVEAALRRAALWGEVKDKLKHSGLSLSGGQQQRLCIARGIAVKSSVLLLDEPCSALDPISTSKIEELMDELKNEYCIVIVTHNMQ